MIQDIDQRSIFCGVGTSDDAHNLQTRSGDELRKFDFVPDEYNRIKFGELNHEALANEESSPLGLTLRKTPSFLDLVEKKLSEGSSTGKTESNSQLISEKEKLKASNFSASLLRIGNWERVSRYEGDLVGKLYYAKRKLVWEVLNSGLKSKIEIQWSEIVGIRATFRPNHPDILEVELNHPPAYFQESNPQPRKHTLWHATEDFTGGQAPVCRRHYLQCPEGTLEKHYEKLLQYDSRVFMLSRGPFPAIPTLYFPKNFDGSNYDDFGGYGYNFHERRQEAPPPPRYASQYPDFDSSRSSSLMEAHSFKINPIDSNSPCSVVEFQGMERGNSEQHFRPPQRPFSWPGEGPRTAVDVIYNQQDRYEFLRPPQHQLPPGFLLQGSPGNNVALTQIEEHLLTDPMAFVHCSDEQRILDKVNSMGNLLNPPPYAAVAPPGAYFQTPPPPPPPPLDTYIPRSSMDHGWVPLQDTHDQLPAQLGRIDQIPNNVTYGHNQNYGNEGQNYVWRQWR